MLTAKELEKRVKEAVKEKRRVTIGCGNYTVLDVSSSGRAVFYYRGKDEHKKTIKEILGTYPRISLARARELSKERAGKLKLIKVQAEQEAEKTPLFGQFADEWLGKKQTEGKNNKRYMNLRALRKKLHGLDGVRLKDLKPLTVMSEVAKLNDTEGNKFRAVQCLNQCLRYAVNLGILEHNPCQYLASKGEGLIKRPKVKGYEYVKPEDLGTGFFNRLINTGELIRLAYLFLSFTCLRISEAVSVQWCWIDTKNKVINIPAEFMKMGRPHSVPLTPCIWGLIKQIKARQIEDSPYLFPSSVDAFKPLPLRHLQSPVTANCKGICTIHGLRKTARTWMADHKVAFDVAERCLAHEEQSQIVRAYNKYDYLKERAEVMEEWDRFVISKLPHEYMQLLK